MAKQITYRPSRPALPSSAFRSVSRNISPRAAPGARTTAFRRPRLTPIA
jgi:hypothetical protein